MRLVLALAGALSLAVGAPASAETTVRHEQVPASRGRTIDLSVWQAARPKGVILFSHGWGNAPADYAPLIRRWVAGGYTVLAPLEVDSASHPKQVAEPQAALGARIEDLQRLRGLAAQRFKGLPVLLAGHSFGSLVAMMGGGAETAAGKLGGPPVAGVIALSSPGAVPGLVTPKSYASLDAPLLLITGDKDVVPGFVADWHDHRQPFDRSGAGGKTLLVLTGADHFAAKGESRMLAPIARASLLFADAYAARSARAKAALRAFRSPLTRIEQR